MHKSISIYTFQCRELNGEDASGRPPPGPLRPLRRPNSPKDLRQVDAARVHL